MRVRRMSEQSFIQQAMTILGLVALVVSLFGSIVLFAADKAIDTKYATDDDLKAVQENFNFKIDELGRAVQRNTEVSQETQATVQQMAVTMLAVQIRELEATVRELEREKSDQGVQWSATEETTLRRLRRSLADLEAQRRSLFSTINGDQ